MGKWRELAEQLEGHDNSDDSANSCPIVTNVTNVTGLPVGIVAGVDRLRSMAAPKVHDLAAWRLAVSDALVLVRDGWAERALSLGWSALDLFGAMPDAAGDSGADGLAAWLGGRRVSVLSDTFALVEDGTRKTYFNRHNRGGSRLLWEFDR